MSKFISTSFPGFALIAFLGLGVEVHAQASDVDCARCVDTTDIASGAVTNGKIADRAVNNKKIETGAVTNGKIANRAVTTKKINPEAVTTGKLARKAVTTEKLARGAVTIDKLEENIRLMLFPDELFIPAAAFNPTGNDFSTFFFDLDGYIIPSNSSNNFCARSPIYIAPERQLDNVDVWYFDNTDGGALVVTILAIPGFGGGSIVNFDPVVLAGPAHFDSFNDQDMHGNVLSVNPPYQSRPRQSLWAEVCIAGDGVNARNLRFYGIGPGVSQ